jgi:hypothetical protein
MGNRVSEATVVVCCRVQRYEAQRWTLWLGSFERSSDLVGLRLTPFPLRLPAIQLNVITKAQDVSVLIARTFDGNDTLMYLHNFRTLLQPRGSIFLCGYGRSFTTALRIVPSRTSKSMPSVVIPKGWTVLCLYYSLEYTLWYGLESRPVCHKVVAHLHCSSLPGVTRARSIGLIRFHPEPIRLDPTGSEVDPIWVRHSSDLCI